MRCRSLLPFLALAACGEGEAPAEVTSAVSPEPVVEEVAAPAFEDSVVSLRVRQSTTVRSLPDVSSAPLGVLAQDMRVTWRGAAPGPGCERWIEIEPRGFVCERVLEPTRLMPRAFELPLQ